METKDAIFEKNIDTLRTLNPELAEAILRVHRGDDLQIVTARNGMPSIKAGNITLHSLYNPKEEAEGWVGYHREEIEKASAVIILGFGLGYHVMEVCNLELCRISSMDVIVFEPRLDILRTALELADLRYVLSRVKIVTGDECPPLTKGFTILEHKPSATLNLAYLERIRPRLKVIKAVKNGLKIMVVGPIFGGSLPIAGYCANALRNMGHDVDFMDNSRYSDTYFSIKTISGDKAHQDQLQALFTAFVSEAVMARCAETKPDLIFVLAQAPLGESCLLRFRANKIPTAFWFVEDFRLMDYWQGVAPLYDYFFTIQRDKFFDKLKEMGLKNFSYLPLAASPDIHKRLDLTKEELTTYGSDVSFAGAGYYNRRNFFKGLLDYDLKIWGTEWEMYSPLGKHIQRSGERIDTEETVKIFNAAKGNINLHSATYYEGINPYGDFVNPRTFEIAACGAFQLVDYRSELPELFKVGEEIICFHDLNDLRKKINYYLSNPGEREEIAQKARERVLRDHTYEHRMEDMLTFIVERGYEPPRWKTEREDVEMLIEEAGRDTEIGRYMSRFSGKTRITVSDITEEIIGGKGELSDIERIFMLIREFKGQFAPMKT